jgi:hypothetical protein
VRGTFNLAELAAEVPVRNVSPAANEHDRWSDREVADGVVGALLSVGEGEAGVDLHGLADAAVAVGLLPARLEYECRASPALGVDVQGESFLERGREGDDAVFAALAPGDPDAAGPSAPLRADQPVLRVLPMAESALRT